jgi:uncharacterized protein YwgA
MATRERGGRMDKRLLPLLLASDRSASPDETEPLDRLRMQKGVFLLAMRGPEGWNGLFKFTPYDWGPYSFDLASTVEGLLADGRLVKEAFPGRRYMRYRTTQAGERLIGELAAQVSPAGQTFVQATRRYVSSRSFARLLREVYKAYPAFAVNSRFAG